MKIKTIKYNKLYKITSTGLVFSNRSNKYLSPNKDKDGYYLIHLTTNGKRVVFKIHRLVAEHFIGKPKNKNFVVNHKNGIKNDNRVENLEWMTRKQNGQHAAKTGLSAKEFDFERTKLSDEDCIQILKLRNFNKLTLKEISDKFNVTFQLISLICLGKTRERVYERFLNINNS